MRTVLDKEAVLLGALSIRCVEESLLDQYRLGRIRGTMHTCIGQEYLPSALGLLRRNGDMWFSNHRGHGHYLGAGLPSQALIDEILGRESGISSGVGGSQHLLGEGFLSNGVQGGLVPIAAGYAFAQTRLDDESMSCVFVGDGTLGQGQFWEALNLSSLMGGPLLFVIEDNGISQSTISKHTIAGDVSSRVRGFGHAYTIVDGQDIDQLCETLPGIVERIRSERRPQVLHVRSARLGAHSKGDDNRDPHQLAQLWDRDPIKIRMTSDPSFTQERESLIESARKQSEQSNQGVASHRVPRDLARDITRLDDRSHESGRTNGESLTEVYSRRQADFLYEALAEALEAFPSSIFIGEDIEYLSQGTAKPYGGAFKVSRDLSERFPGRVLNSPISEAGITGFSIGHALAGAPAIVEIMFGDFLTQAIDQLLQQASKIPTMFGRSVRLPLIARTPMGGGLGYGATHSQSIERLVFGLPNLLVIAVGAFPTGIQMFSHLLSLGLPALVLEDKLSYRAEAPDLPAPFSLEIDDSSPLPAYMRSRVVRSSEVKPKVSVATYGGATRKCLEAQQVLANEHDVHIEVVEFTLLSPLRLDELLSSLTRSNRLLVVEQGQSSFGFGSELVASCIESGMRMTAVERIGCRGIIPANSQGEDAQTPTANQVVSRILDMLGRS